VALPIAAWRAEAIRYGSDKPDLRCGAEIHDLRRLPRLEFRPQADRRRRQGCAASRSKAHASRSQLDVLVDQAKAPLASPG
jgi:aspartyl-tRNA synthetase